MKYEEGGGAPRFVAHFRVRYHEMDVLGHVNNAVYLHYLEQAAVEHSAALGYDMARLAALGGVFIARRHEIEYLRPAAAGDALAVVTWAVELKGAHAVRDYAIHRHGAAAGAPLPADGFLAPGASPPGPPLVTARTLWAWVDPATGRPRRLPAELLAAFQGSEKYEVGSMK
jgi:acyl-CoA thioester hydrolase